MYGMQKLITLDNVVFTFMHRRQCRLLYLTFRRESRKCGEHDDSDVSEEEREERKNDPKYSDYWQKRVNTEESTAAFLTAIAILVEDASEITIAVHYHRPRRTTRHNWSVYFYNSIQNLLSGEKKINCFR